MSVDTNLCGRTLAAVWYKAKFERLLWKLDSHYVIDRNISMGDIVYRHWVDKACLLMASVSEINVFWNERLCYNLPVDNIAIIFTS